MTVQTLRASKPWLQEMFPSISRAEESPFKSGARWFEWVGRRRSKKSIPADDKATVQNKYERKQMLKSLLHGGDVAPTLSLFNLHNLKKEGGRRGGWRRAGLRSVPFSLYIRSGWLQVNLRIHFITARQNFATTLNIQAQIHKNVSPKRNQKTK